MATKNSKKLEEMMEVRQLRPPKLKDTPAHRSRITLNFKEQFGFIPEILIIDKVRGKHGHLIISAVLPKDMVDREKSTDTALAKKKKGKKQNGSTNGR